jgi:hypothetical protein
VVAPPEDRRLRHVIDTMALHVLDGGCAFEQAVMERGRGNPLFDFLFDLKSKEHTYYVWRLYSFAQVLVDLYIFTFSIDVSSILTREFFYALFLRIHTSTNLAYKDSKQLSLKSPLYMLKIAIHA